MLNELLRDPMIQQRYQFLLYMYPTGVPIPIAAAGLRDVAARGREDVQRPAAATRRSTRWSCSATAWAACSATRWPSTAATQFWELNSDRPFDEILGPPEVLDELTHYMFFEPLPFVSRVVFLATPHRGSDYEPTARRPGRLEPDLRARPHHTTCSTSSSRTTPTPSTPASSAACRRASRRSTPTRTS